MVKFYIFALLSIIFMTPSSAKAWGEFATGISYNSVYDKAAWSGVFGKRSELISVDAALKLGLRAGFFVVGAASSVRLGLATQIGKQELGDQSGLQLFPIAPLVALDFSKFRLEAQYQPIGSYSVWKSKHKYSSPSGVRFTLSKLSLGKGVGGVNFHYGFYAEFCDYKKTTGAQVRFVNTGLQIGFDF